MTFQAVKTIRKRPYRAIHKSALTVPLFSRNQEQLFHILANQSQSAQAASQPSIDYPLLSFSRLPHPIETLSPSNKDQLPNLHVFCSSSTAPLFVAEREHKEKRIDEKRRKKKEQVELEWKKGGILYGGSMECWNALKIYTRA